MSARESWTPGAPLRVTTWTDNDGRAHVALEYADTGAVRAPDVAPLEVLEAARAALTLEAGREVRDALRPSWNYGYGAVTFWPFHTGAGGPSVTYRLEERER